ncbi:hypothetical protein MJ575_15205 [Klebsiella pneumoniae]|nr:hypothetical protein MJ575_15205 [Klebsiella pneumoniae]
MQLTLDIRGPQDAPLTLAAGGLLGGRRPLPGRRRRFAAEVLSHRAATACDSHLQAVLS